ncbi:DPP IV N-terminal domain-containing protein [Labilibaculum sp. K2S]|uniref:S9 family peptidase n=1 Tax=Labilibaculum sp. K2S TaxID=3056386 RepID=UPI0025A39471|nr:DPP IV N-terminal domain-containing protein [Labilibaculum sp. K2S]MDM8160932.1 DPP IV N-terminal domain-containing protein [Labilibaculum sp. K2S]
MKRNLLTLLFLTIGIGLFAQEIPVAKANYELAAKFSPNRLKKIVFSTSVTPHWLKNGEKFWYNYKTSEGNFYYLVDPVSSTKSELFNAVKMAADMSRLTADPFDAEHLDISKLKFINNEKTIQFEVKSKLVEEEEKDDENGDKQEEEKEGEKKQKAKKKMVAKVWHFEYQIASKQLNLLSEFEKPLEQKDWASVAPNQEYVVFAKHHNLYWMDAENYKKAQKNEKDSTIIEHELTTDGVKYYSYGSGTYGKTNKEIEEEKDKRKAAYVTFSADSKKFALTREDEREVKDLWVINSVASPRPTLESYKYHMPGEKEAPQYEILIFDWESKKSVKVKASAFKDQTLSILRAPRKKMDADDDLQFSKWLSAGSDLLYFERQSRDMKRVDICTANTSTGEVKVLIEERLNTYIETRPLGFVNNGRELIHWSERDGWAHFYLYDGEGNLKNQITSGPWHCDRIQGIDEKNRVLYFTGNAREKDEDPYYTHLYSVNFDGTGLKLLNKGNFSHDVSLNDQNHYFVNNSSRVNTAPVSALYNSKGSKLIDLEATDLSRLFETGYQFPELFKVKAGDGVTDIYGVMYKPFDFDPNKKYPILTYVYPGPQTEAVYKSFSTRMDRADRMAQLGFIVVTLGNRGGHPARSKWYHNYGYGNLRDYGLEDKKVGLEQLADRFDFIDITKVGIFGHSGGGFMSTAAMLVYPDFFKVAVSAAGNHDNNIYNRWWSETHHGVKEEISEKGDTTFTYKIDDNPSLAKNLKGKLMIVTGDIDNNVHPGNTIRMANALIKANKRFDFFIYPGQRHGFGDMSEYSFWLRGEYFCKYLLGDFRNSADYIEMQNDKPKK